MDYEKKYKEALEKAREWYNKTEPDSYTCIVESIFPELKESEDEELLKCSLYNLREIEQRFGAAYGKVGKCMDWLKSLKERVIWKPSEMQLSRLKEECDKYWEPDGLDTLYTLYQDLKKL